MPASKRKAVGTASERPKRVRKDVPASVEERTSQSTADPVPLVTRKTRAKRGLKDTVPASQSFVDAYIASKTASQVAASEPSLGEASVHARESLSPLKETENAEVGGQDDTKAVDSEETDDDLMIIDDNQIMETPEAIHAEVSKEASLAEKSTKSQHSSSAPSSSKLRTKRSVDKAESLSTAKPSSSTQTLAAELKINLPMNFDYDLDNFDFSDDEGDDQSLKEVFPELQRVDTPEVAQAKGVIKKIFLSSSLPAMGEQMDLFQGALNVLKKSVLPSSEEAKKISTLLAETPRLVAQMNETGKTLKISSDFLADVQAKETAFNSKKSHLKEISAKSKAGQAKIEELNKVLADLRSQVEKVEEELKGYDHIAASKTECDAVFCELHQLNKELKKKQALKSTVEEKKKMAEEATAVLLGQWEALIKENSL